MAAMIVLRLAQWILLITAIPTTISASAYTWPSVQYDTLEQFLYEGENISGKINLANSTKDCAKRGAGSGSTQSQSSTVAAEWLRFAFHDMAGHNETDGTGGLDASIFYELDRLENLSAGIANAANDFLFFRSKYVSRSDIIAMGAVWAVASCGGPAIPFRYGRVDASIPGRKGGVPFPTEDLGAHTEHFRLQGFSPTEMIALVACGHTLGGVRSVDFPHVVPDPSHLSIATFDTTTAFDHAIVTEYLDSSTQNPLIRAANTTFNSDGRIFSSDGNVTMKGLNSQASFFNTCTPLLERLINTVPTNVVLSDVVPLLPVKVSNAQITVIGSDLVFMTTLRISYPNNTTPLDPHNVRMMWCDGRGAFKDCQRLTNVATNPVLGNSPTSPLTTSLGIALSTYDFKVPLSADRSVSRFWFEVEDGSSLGTVYDNEGKGYYITQDEIIHVPWLGSVHIEDQSHTYNLVFGVRSESNPSSALIHALDLTGTGALPLFNSTIELQKSQGEIVADGYSMWRAPPFTDLGSILTVDVEMSMNGVTYTADYLGTGHLGSQDPIFLQDMSSTYNITSDLT